MRFSYVKLRFRRAYFIRGPLQRDSSIIFIGHDEIRRRIDGRRLMTVARRPRRIRKVMRPLLQWYYNLNLLVSPPSTVATPLFSFRASTFPLVPSVARSVPSFVHVRTRERALSVYVLLLEMGSSISQVPVYSRFNTFSCWVLIIFD